jgi:hypothetical protein
VTANNDYANRTSTIREGYGEFSGGKGLIYLG